MPTPRVRNVEDPDDNTKLLELTYEIVLPDKRQQRW